MSRPSHPPRFVYPNNFWWSNVLQLPPTSPLIGQNILLSTLFSNTLNRSSSLCARD
jgi:hypothetical protein